MKSRPDGLSPSKTYSKSYASNMAYRVELSARAKRDLDLILTRLLAQGAGETGLRWWFGLRDKIGTLADLPERCALAPENETASSEIRELLYGRRQRYRILCKYKPTKSTSYTFATDGKNQPS